MAESTDWARQARADLTRERRRNRRRSGTVTVRLSFQVSRHSREAIAMRLYARDHDKLPTAAEIREWALGVLFDEVDDLGRILECVEMDCLDTDDDHDHADGPKR